MQQVSVSTVRALESHIRFLQNQLKIQIKNGGMQWTPKTLRIFDKMEKMINRISVIQIRYHNKFGKYIPSFNQSV